MIKKMKLNVIHGKSLKMTIQADKETIARLRQGIKAVVHNVKEETSYKLSNPQQKSESAME